MWGFTAFQPCLARQTTLHFQPCCSHTIRPRITEPLSICPPAEPGGFKVKAAVRQGGGRRTKAAATPAQGEEEGDGAAGSPAGGDNSPAGSGSADKAAGQREEEEEDAAAERRVGRSGDPLDDVSAEFRGGGIVKSAMPRGLQLLPGCLQLGMSAAGARSVTPHTALRTALCISALPRTVCQHRAMRAGGRSCSLPSKAQSLSFY